MIDKREIMIYNYLSSLVTIDFNPLQNKSLQRDDNLFPYDDNLFVVTRICQFFSCLEILLRNFH